MRGNCDCVRDCEPCVDASREVCEQPLTPKDSYQPSVTARQMGHVKARDVRIEQQDLGYIVRVGCQTFCFENLDTVLKLVGEYLWSPDDMEKKWRDGTIKFK
jgi:hypothetical protein